MSEPLIKVKLIDLTAKADSEPTATDIQTFADINDIKTDFTVSKYATLEPEQWLFGENFKILPDDLSSLTWGLWSLSQSDVNGDFASSVDIDVSFDDPHTSNGITLDFWQITDDYCNDITIEWYDNVDSLIATQDFTPDAAFYFCNLLVENYYRVVIKLKSTNKAQRYAKLKNVEYGEIALFDETKITTANLNEEVDLTTDKITINTLDFQIIFDTTEKANEFLSVVQETQEVIAQQTENGSVTELGTFYIDTKSRSDENVLEVNTQDLIGRLDDTDFIGGIYSNVTAKTIIDSIMASFGTTLYEIDSDLQNRLVSGWLPRQSHKDSLQDVVFAVNGVVDCSRSDLIKIYAVDTSTVKTLDRSDTFTYAELDMDKQLKPVTGISLSLKSYNINATSKELYKVTHSAGTHTAFFSTPSVNYSITNGTITSSGANFCTFTTTGGEVIINGNNYDESISTVQKENVLSANIKSNILPLENTLTWDIEENSDYLLEYETSTSKVEFEIEVDDLKVGDYIQIDTYNDKTFTGFVVSVDINLSGGFLGNVVAYGKIE